MDFPFEYVERVMPYPKFDHHFLTSPSLERLGKARKGGMKAGNKPAAEQEEEQEKPFGKRQVREDDAEKALKKEIGELEAELRAAGTTTTEDESTETCTSSASGCNESLVDTCESDIAIVGLGEDGRDKLAATRFKIMNECVCTDSECESNSTLSTLPISTTSESEEEEIVSEAEDEEKKELEAEEVGSESSEETSESSDDEIGLDTAIERLERILEEKTNPGGVKKSDEEEEISDGLDGVEATSEEDSEEEEEEAKSGEEEGGKEKEKEASGSLSSSSSSSTSTSSSSSPLSASTNSCPVTSSATDDDEWDSDGGQHFNWDSDDLYKSTDTDSDLERVVDFLDNAMKIVDGVFNETNVAAVANTPLDAQKYRHFELTYPEMLETGKKYEMMEEPEKQSRKEEKETKKKKNKNDELEKPPKKYWLVQQIDSGMMHSAKIVSRRHPDHVLMQKDLDNERKLLRQLLPELGEPTHIARLLDAGFNEDFKYLIFEDLGTDLYHLFDQFSVSFDAATIFLVSYFTFDAIKELHRFGIVHTDVRPTAFSVQKHPFNVKIVEYGKARARGAVMKTTENMRPDSFSPRAFHQKDVRFDDFVDFESWIYTMIFLCTKIGLPWFGDAEHMLQLKEHYFNNPLDYLDHKGCVEAVPMATSYINDHTIGYDQFIEKMKLIFSVDAMRFPDTAQPIFFSVADVKRYKPGKFNATSDKRMRCDHEHWNPADESDSSDAIKSDDERLIEKELVGGKAAEKKEKSASCPMSATEQMSSSAPSSAPQSEKEERTGGREQSTQEQSTMPETAAADEQKSSAASFREERSHRKMLSEVPLSELYGSQSSSSTSESSSATSFSSWTSSTSASEFERRKKEKARQETEERLLDREKMKKNKKTRWRQAWKPHDERAVSDVDYFSGLDEYERAQVESYQTLVTAHEKENPRDSSDSDDSVGAQRKPLVPRRAEKSQKSPESSKMEGSSANERKSEAAKSSK
ncbi:unnamed protein product [Caenorhabditis sp. 36 PRJEB53466]|nr:unnamed protein product [Caenorhabditis sp. 36 PRJEB53466]